MAVDAYFSQVSLLLLGGGSNGSTTISDSSLNTKTMTDTGSSVTITTSEFKYGTGSIAFAGSSYLNAPTGVDFEFSGDLTLECWVKTGAQGSGDYTIFSCGSDPTGSNGAYVSISGHYIRLYTAGTDTGSPGGALTSANSSGYYHVAVVRASGVWKLYVDGVLAGSITNATSITEGIFTVGGASGFGSFLGFMDDVRVTKGLARYTADFTPPIEELPSTSLIGADITMPVPTLTFSGGLTEVHYNAYLTAPIAQSLTYGGVNASINCPWSVSIVGGSSGAVTLPAATVSASSGAVMELTSPTPTALIVGGTITGANSFTYTLSSPTLSIYGGGNAALACPATATTITATFTGLGTAELTAPAALVDATGTTSATASAELSAPMIALIGYGGAVCSITLTDSPTVAASGTSGLIGGAAITLPLFELEASGSQPGHGSADLIAPAARLGATLQAYLAAPSARLTAIGHAVVTATYEAYAVNLKHQPVPGKEPIDEVTRYTNFPFTHIVRYKNSYFGVNSTGLYLLDGTTDYASPTPTPVPWTFKTALMDFKSPYQKTVASAYFGGRLGAADTITLYAGEGAGTAYSYTTPRGALAQNHRQAFGKGIKQHRYYAVGANGTDVLELDTIGLDVHLMTRKV